MIERERTSGARHKEKIEIKRTDLIHKQTNEIEKNPHFFPIKRIVNQSL